MEKLNLDKKALKKFGVTMGIALAFIALFIFFRHKYDKILIFIAISTTFFILAFTAPVFLKPVYILWMRLASILGWINTRLILLILFYLVFTPIGLVMKLLRFDPLDRKIDKNKTSYWNKKEVRDFNPLDYEKQF